MGRRALLVLLAGCYQPTIGVGEPCGPGGACPIGQTCIASLCELGDAASPGDARDGPVDAPPLAGWSVPTLVPGLVSAGTTNDGDPWLSPDLLTLVFERTINGDDIYTASRPDLASSFSLPIALSVVNSTLADHSPEIDVSGQGATGPMTLYFATNRMNGQYDIWTAFPVGATWTAPVRDAILSSDTLDDFDIAIAPDGLTAIISRGVGGQPRFFRSTRAATSQAWSTPTMIAELTLGQMGGPSLTADGTLYFHSQEPGMARDLFVSRRNTTDIYQTPTPIPELDTSMRESDPFISADERHIVFERAGRLFESHR